MKAIRLLAAAAALLLAVGAVPAQPGPGSGPGSGAMTPHGPGRMGGRWGTDFTPGWSMMTPAERQEHQARMRSMTGYEECTAYMGQHHQQMAARAKDKGRTVPAQPRRDPCVGLKR